MALCQASEPSEDSAPDWDWEAAGIPSALTPEAEAQQAARQVRGMQHSATGA